MTTEEPIASDISAVVSSTPDESPSPQGVVSKLYKFEIYNLSGQEQGV